MEPLPLRCRYARLNLGALDDCPEFEKMPEDMLARCLYSRLEKPDPNRSSSPDACDLESWNLPWHRRPRWLEACLRLSSLALANRLSSLSAKC